MFDILPVETNSHYAPLFEQLQLSIDAFLHKQKSSFQAMAQKSTPTPTPTLRKGIEQSFHLY